MKIIKNKKLFAGMAALALTISGLTFAGNSLQRVKWTSPGNCGIPRAGYEDDVLRQSYYMTMPSSAGTYANFFYPVNVDSQQYSPDWTSLSARFRKAGSSERIRVYLKEYRHDIGVTYTRKLMDSASSPSTTNAQFISDWDGYAGWNFQNPNSVFFVEVRMYKSASGGAPRLYSLRLSGDIG